MEGPGSGLRRADEQRTEGRADAAGVVGSVFSSRYRDRGPLARGGFSEIRRALDVLMDRHVAVKVLAWQHLDDAGRVARFRREAAITAFLEHPGVVPVYDRGEMDDGRPWFAMKEIRGATLAAALADARERPPGTERRRALRALVGAFHRMCEAVSYAHSRGVIHRDLKPANLMKGEFGEALVMDWGLAKREGMSEDLALGVPTTRSADETEAGDVFGTVPYMAPEQALGATDEIGPGTDVFALGLVLFELLTGRRAYRGDGPPLWAKAIRGEVELIETDQLLDEGFADLREVVTRATRRESSERYADASGLARALQMWLDGEARRQRARDLFEGARAAASSLAVLRAREAEAGRRLLVARRDIRDFDPVEQKARVWDLEDEQRALRHEREALEAEQTASLEDCLHHDPAFLEAKVELARVLRGAADAAERSGQAHETDRICRRLEALGLAEHESFVRRRGAVEVRTDPSGVAITARRFVLEGRRWVLGEGEALGVTPLAAHEMAAGSYMLEMSQADRAWRHPVRVPRGANATVEVTLPSTEIEEGSQLVLAGWFTAGGDARAAEPIPERRVWVDTFVIRAFPVTVAEYFAFLDALVDAGDAEAAEQHAPRLQPGASRDGAPAFVRRGSGHFEPAPDEMGRIPDPRAPIALVSWHDARAYARWQSARTGLDWRLPNELEWEKAGRGADARHFPWGNEPEPTWARVLGATEEVPSRVPVDAYPVDESPYGVRGMAGNVRDWCENVWSVDGPPLDAEGRLVHREAPEAGLRSIRGGAWSTVPDLARLASRFAAPPDARFPVVGFRLARSLTET